MAREPTGQSTRGVAVAVVRDNEDPQGVGRVKLGFPRRDAEEVWARVAAPMAGDGYGAYFLPEIDDEVLVAFDGHTGDPYVLGALWSARRPPPVDNADGDNDRRVIESRSGHRLTFDDAATDGKVEVETNAGHRVVLDDEKGSERVRIEDASGDSSVEMDSSSGEVTIEAGEKLSLSAPTVEIEADADVNVAANQTVDVSGKARTNVANNGELELSSDGTTRLTASGPLSIQGALIRLN